MAEKVYEVTADDGLPAHYGLAAWCNMFPGGGLCEVKDGDSAGK